MLSNSVRFHSSQTDPKRQPKYAENANIIPLSMRRPLPAPSVPRSIRRAPRAQRLLIDRLPRVLGHRCGLVRTVGGLGVVVLISLAISILSAYL